MDLRLTFLFMVLLKEKKSNVGVECNEGIKK